MRFKTLTTAVVISAAAVVAAACEPTPPPPPPPVLIPPAVCGATIDGKAWVTTYSDAPRCVPPAGVKRIVASELCGPTMAGSNAVDDCYRGYLAQVPGRALYGWHIMRAGSFNQPGDVRQSFVASDYVAA